MTVSYLLCLSLASLASIHSLISFCYSYNQRVLQSIVTVPDRNVWSPSTLKDAEEEKVGRLEAAVEALGPVSD